MLSNVLYFFLCVCVCGSMIALFFNFIFVLGHVRVLTVVALGNLFVCSGVLQILSLCCTWTHIVLIA